MNIPTELRYTKEHEWIRAEGDIGTIGITDYAQDQLGDIVYLDLPAAGASLAQNDKLGEIESVKAVSDLYAPVSGEVLEVNQEAVDEPEAVNEEPYGKGWLIKVRLSNASELDAMLTNEAYDELIVREMEEHTD
ncbi:MAG: glycine cleavage system protein GcvH [Chloroflexi bacterium]|nr:glycine cleavage system protein GcvH [Chloroflexota bacterium]